MVAQASWEGLRAQALAKVFLTRTQDLDVIDVPLDPQEAGYDLIARAKNDQTPGAPIFAVEIKAVRDGLSNGRKVFKFKSSRHNLEWFDLPLLLLLVELGNEVGHYTWLIEPRVDPDGQAVLEERHDLWSSSPDDGTTLSVPRDSLKKLDKDAVRQLTQQALAWQRARDRLTHRRVFPSEGSNSIGENDQTNGQVLSHASP